VLDGSPTSGLTDDQLTRLRREKVGFVFHSFQLIHTLSVVENVELPLLLAGRSDAQELARERLQWVEMEHLAERMPHQLSGGEMQRTAIARALVHAPRIVLADEPTGNLDTTTGSIVLSLLRRIATAQGTTILMATHSAEATAIADVVFRMRDGRIEDAVRR
jgi:ABC-type lipoprotein export system ATPase subunit